MRCRWDPIWGGLWKCNLNSSCLSLGQSRRPPGVSEALDKWRWSPPIRKSGWPGSIPIPDDKGRVPELGDGVVSALWWGRDPVGDERGAGVVSERWQNRHLGAVCTTNNPASWLVAWRCKTTHRARPGGELLLQRPSLEEQ